METVMGIFLGCQNELGEEVLLTFSRRGLEMLKYHLISVSVSPKMPRGPPLKQRGWKPLPSSPSSGPPHLPRHTPQHALLSSCCPGFHIYCLRLFPNPPPPTVRLAIGSLFSSRSQLQHHHPIYSFQSSPPSQDQSIPLISLPQNIQFSSR